MNQDVSLNDIRVSEDGTCFMHNDRMLFNKRFLAVMNFHPPGLASVCDESGWYHITLDGMPLYPGRYKKAFGYYCGRAAVVDIQGYSHIDIHGNKLESESVYKWCGNYQDKLCVVRDYEDHFFHVDLVGKRIYEENYLYAGDFREGYACVLRPDNEFIHINRFGKPLNGKSFLMLGPFHKGLATAKDKEGWFHINKKGDPLYRNRYDYIEPFYNDFALVEKDGLKIILNGDSFSEFIIP